ncbi:hypothetical protein AB6A40_010065 [Gnathostoma spinigerum]|uniref:F-box domain-containing protein n=1 Tax=Gnathostoma spinigerum TaxID=75299 RepID=A0ABD6EVI0_9BILA
MAAEVLAHRMTMSSTGQRSSTVRFSLAAKRRRKSLWRLAKCLMRSTHQTYFPPVNTELSPCLIPQRSIASADKSEQLLPNVLLYVLENVDLENRIRLRQICHLTESLFLLLPVRFPPIKIHSTANRSLELFISKPDLIIKFLLPDLHLSVDTDTEGVISLRQWQAELVVLRIAAHVDHIEHLWLETNINGLLCSALMNQLTKCDNEMKSQRPRRLTMKKLTIVGESTKFDIVQYARLIAHVSPKLEQLRLRHFRLESRCQSKALWSSINNCSALKQFQYESCILDRYSHEFVSDVLRRKCLEALEIGGINGFRDSDLLHIATNKPLRNLSVVCPLISPASYLQESFITTLFHLDTLLIECDSMFSLDDLEQRETLTRLLSFMKVSSHLEVAHVVDNHVAQAARAMSYWLELSRETQRTIMLKLTDISQDRIDQATGRLLRKCDNVFKGPTAGYSLVLTRGAGRIHVLDRYTWFGEDENEDEC